MEIVLKNQRGDIGVIPTGGLKLGTTCILSYPVLSVGSPYLQGLAVVQHSFRTDPCKAVGVHTAAMQTDLFMGVVDTYRGLPNSFSTSLKPKPSLKNRCNDPLREGDP